MTNVGEAIRPATPQAGADALHQRGLAGAERAAEHDQVACSQHRREPPTEVVRVGDGREADHAAGLEPVGACDSAPGAAAAG